MFHEESSFGNTDAGVTMMALTISPASYKSLKALASGSAGAGKPPRLSSVQLTNAAASSPMLGSQRPSLEAAPRRKDHKNNPRVWSHSSLS